MSRRLVAAVAVFACACSTPRMQSSKSLAMDDHMAHMSAADMVAPSVTHSSSTYQGDPSLPPSAQTAEARLKASPRHAEWAKIAWEPGSKDSLMAWIVYPVSRNKAPVVVVVHEIFGLSTWVRGVADQVAAEGFIAIAPDFLSRVRGGPSTEELPAQQASQLINGRDGVMAAEQNRAIIAAANYAMMQPAAVQKYAVIGYCWGGQTTFHHVINGGVKGFAGGVAFYGLPYTSGGRPATATTAAVPSSIDVDSLKKIKTPVMLLSGTGDARITAAMPALDSLMKVLHKDYFGKNYEGAIHGFLRAQDDTLVPNPNRPPTDSARAAFKRTGAANLAATKDAWPRTVAFLKKQLGVK